MPNSIGVDGIETASADELREQFNTAFRAIYGDDINLDPDSPDGQAIGIFIQAILDNSDLLVQINNMFDPDNAIGRILDQRVTINGIQRLAGTRTITNITVVVNKSVNLYGADQDVEQIYTVADNAGTRWQLISTEEGLAAGTHVLPFQAEFPGATLTTPNTINVPVTIVLGVVSVNNPTVYSSLGLNEETDSALKVRRQRSVSISSQGYLDGLIAALSNINGNTGVFVYENNTDDEDSDGVPGHSIWVIIGGAVEDEDVAQAIYTKRNAGCGMKGDETYTITQRDGSLFVVRWDVVESEDLYMQFDVERISGSGSIDLAALKEYLVENFVPGVFEKVNITHLGAVVQEFDSDILVTNAGFALSGGGPFTSTLEPSAKNKQFAVSADNMDITEV